MFQVRFYKNSVQSKIMTLGAIAMIIIASVIIGYSAVNLFDEAFKKAEFNVEASTLIFLSDMNTELNKPGFNAQATANAIQGLFGPGKTPSRDQVTAILESSLENNPELYGAYAGFEPNALDNKDALHKNARGSDRDGRFVPYFFRGEDGIGVEPLEGMDTNENYIRSKSTMRPSVSEPFLYDAGGETVLLSSFEAPIVVNGKFIGISGVDIGLDSLMNKAEQFSMYDGKANFILFSKEGVVIGQNMKYADWNGKNAFELPLEKVGINPKALAGVLEKAQKGEFTLYTADGYTKTLVPVKIGDTGTYWDIAVTVPEEIIRSEPVMKIIQLVILGAIFIAIGLVILYLVARSIARPIVAVTDMAAKFAEGDISTGLVIDQEDEIGRLARAFALLGENLEGKSVAAGAIADGDLSVDIPVAGPKDRLGNAMVTMRQNIRQIVEEIGKISEHSGKGDLSFRGNHAGFSGEYESIIFGLNETLDGVVTPVTEAMRLADGYAKRNFLERFDPSLEVEGDFAMFRASLDQIGISASSAMNEVKDEVINLKSVMEETNSNAGGLLDTANVISKNSDSVGSLAERSGSGLRQTLTAMEDLSLTVSSVAAKAGQASDMANHAVDLSNKGFGLAGDAEKGMEAIIESVYETNVIISDIVGQMEEIGNIVDVITGISEQTGLLALNAAIEAARAGDAGRGFAVVADEVKTLALESQKSAENIAAIIGNLQKKSQVVSESMKTSATEVKAGNEAVRETIGVFKQIVDAINAVNANMSEVAGATEEQAAAVQEITASVNEVGTLVQQTAKEAVDSATATKEATMSIDQISRAISEATRSVVVISDEMERFVTK